MNVQEWFEQKFIEWERTQGSRQSYYNFARYLEVSHTALTQWLNGTARPAGDDLENIAARLGSEVYTILGMRSDPDHSITGSDAYQNLPTALRSRLDHAIGETGQTIAQRKISPESDEAKRLALKIFEKWGFHITG